MGIYFLIIAIVCGFFGGMVPAVLLKDECRPKNILIKVLFKDSNRYRDMVKEDRGDCVDLYVPKNIKYKAGDTVFIDFEVAMALPKGYEAHIYPRSSTFKHTGLLLTNGVGIVDNSYSGNNDTWKAMFYATRDGEINAGDRVCQFRVCQNQPHPIFLPVNSLSDKGRGGYGTSGR